MAGVDGFTPTEMADLITSVADSFGPDKTAGQNIPSRNRFNYLFRPDAPRTFDMMKMLYSEDKIAVQGGEYVSFHVVIGEQGTASFYLPGRRFEPGIVNVLKKGTIPWRHAQTNWSILDEEMKGCRGEEEIVDLVFGRRLSALYDLALTIEDEMWAAAPALADETLPLTIPYWIVPITAAQITDDGSFGSDVSGAFQGTAPVGHTDVGGINPGVYTGTVGWDTDTYKRWRNWNANRDTADGTYTHTDDERMDNMFLHLGFEVPPNVDELKSQRFNRRRVDTDKVTLHSMQEEAKKQNDQIGYDLANYRGLMTWRGYPVHWQNALDTYSASRGYYPIYLTDFAHAGPVVREGYVFTRKSFPADRYQIDVTTTYELLDYNFGVFNRQLFGGMLSYVA